jgi:DNA-binding MarR family transcriptional regulator
LSSRLTKAGADAEVARLAEKFIETVPQAMRELRVEFRSQRGSELSVPQFRVMARLHQCSQTNKELADFIGISVAAMSRMVDGMIADGLVEKTVGHKDRREVRIKLSAAGQKLYGQIRARTRVGLAKRLESLSRAEVRALGAGLSVLERAFSV